MYCSQCGSHIPNQAKFCTACGTMVDTNAQPKMTPQSSSRGTDPVPTIKVAESTTKIGLNIFFVIAGVLVIVICILIIVFFMFTDGKSLSKKSEKSSTVNKQKVEKEEIIQKEITESEKMIIEINSTYEKKEYIEAIDLILSLDWDDFTQDETDSILIILENCISLYISETKITIQELAQQNNIDEALALYLDLKVFIERMEINEIAVSYISISTEELSELQIYLYEIYVEVYYDILYQIAITGDEAALAEKLEQCKLQIDITYYEILQARIYTTFVIHQVTTMISSQIATEEILIFIDKYLELTRYSAYCLELWDNQFSQYRNSHKIASWDSSITHISSNQYILEDSSTRLLTESDISHLTRYELYVARFEIYARHGRGFADPSLTQYFEKCNWYQFQISNIDFDEFHLSDIEFANIKLIYSYEVSCGYYHFESMTLEQMKEQPKQQTTGTHSSAKGAKAFEGAWGVRTTNSGTGVVVSITVNSDSDITIVENAVGGGAMYNYTAKGQYNAQTNRIEIISIYCDYDYSYPGSENTQWVPDDDYLELSGDKLVWYENGRIIFSNTRYHEVTI